MGDRPENTVRLGDKEGSTQLVNILVMMTSGHFQAGQWRCVAKQDLPRCRCRFLRTSPLWVGCSRANADLIIQSQRFFQDERERPRVCQELPHLDLTDLPLTLAGLTVAYVVRDVGEGLAHCCNICHQNPNEDTEIIQLGKISDQQESEHLEWIQHNTHVAAHVCRCAEYLNRQIQIFQI